MNATQLSKQAPLATAAHRSSSKPSRDLAAVLDEVASSISAPSGTQVRVLERLNVLRRRLATERFQLAMLGQFKRGKSTVLNALLGKSVLPIGVVPVTAIPTFLEAAAALKLRVSHLSSKVEEFVLKSMEALREKLTAFVTEEGNIQHSSLCVRVKAREILQQLESEKLSGFGR